MYLFIHLFIFIDVFIYISTKLLNCYQTLWWQKSDKLPIIKLKKIVN